MLAPRGPEKVKLDSEDYPTTVPWLKAYIALRRYFDQRKNRTSNYHGKGAVLVAAVSYAHHSWIGKQCTLCIIAGVPDNIPDNIYGVKDIMDNVSNDA